MTRKSNLLALFVLALLFALAVPISAQMDDSYDRTIDKKFIAEVIDTVSATLNEYYIFGDVAKEMEDHLRMELKKGTYDTITSLSALMQTFHSELREICHDRHFGMREFSDEQLAEMSAEPSADEKKKRGVRQLAGLRYENFGLYKLERLPGNIGYLDLRGFVDASYGGETAIAAMKFLSHSNAVVIDLRENGGGSPSMIQLISSYFFDEPKHLNSFYIRSKDTIEQFWTQAYVDGKKMVDTPLYILTSSNTFSAAEEFTYNMKNMKRAKIVGETTGGGAHPVDQHFFPNLNFGMRVPYGRAINPISGTNWEGTGIEPDIKVPAADALMAARLDAMKGLKETETDEMRKFELSWDI